MRITGGLWVSRRLRGPSRGMPLRPTPDAMRERAFAVLGGRLDSASVLDLFAGTGAVGLEALSRGARRAVFVDSHRAAAALIRANCAAIVPVPAAGPSAGRGRGEPWRVIIRPAEQAVRELARRGERFDLIWADPPFEAWRLGLEALLLAGEQGLLAAGAIACLECPAEADLTADDIGRLAGAGLETGRDLQGGASRVMLLHAAEGTLPAPAERRHAARR